MNEEEPILTKQQRIDYNAESDTEPQMRRIRIHKNKKQKCQSLVFVTKTLNATKEVVSRFRQNHSHAEEN